MVLTPTDYDWLALCLCTESNNPAEWPAIAQVIENRCRTERWGRTYRDVILARMQFSAFNVFTSGKPDFEWLARRQDILLLRLGQQDHPGDPSLLQPGLDEAGRPAAGLGSHGEEALLPRGRRPREISIRRGRRMTRLAMGRSIAASWRAAGFALPPCPYCGAGYGDCIGPAPLFRRPPTYLHADRLRRMGKWPVEDFHRLPVAR